MAAFIAFHVRQDRSDPISFAVSLPVARPVLKRCIRANASLEFVRGVKEDVIPDVKLTKSRDGTSGTATFVFQNPSVFEVQHRRGEGSVGAVGP